MIRFVCHCSASRARGNFQIIERELQEKPHDPFSLFNAGGTLLDMGDEQQALSYLTCCIQTAPKGASFLAKAYIMVAQIHRQAGDLNRARSVCDEGLVRIANNPELLFESGLVFQQQKNPSAAIDAFEKILTLPPAPTMVGCDQGVSSYLTHHHLGQCYQALGNADSATTHWQKATELAPQFGPPWIGLMELYWRDGQFGKLENLIVRAGQSQPGYMKDVLTIRYLLLQRRWTEAETMMEAVTQKAPKVIWLRILFADMYVKDLQRPERAIEHWQEVLRLDPGQKAVARKLQKALDSVRPQ